MYLSINLKHIWVKVFCCSTELESLTIQGKIELEFGSSKFIPISSNTNLLNSLISPFGKLVNFFIENGYSGFIGDLADTTAYFLEHYADCSDILEIESTDNLDTILITDINNTVFEVVLNIEANRVEKVSVIK